MGRIDIATLTGMLVGVAVVGLAIYTGSNFGIFVNVPGLLIVFGGTFAATLVKFPLAGVFVALPVGAKAAFTNEKIKPRAYIKESLRLVKKARQDGLHTVEDNKIANPFFKKGVQLVADGRDLPYIRKILTQDMAHSIAQHEQGAKIFLAIGEAAPAFGMFGTLVGLVQMLSTMDDPTKIGPAMAIALLTTLYGVLIANLVALPIADKLESKSREERDLRYLVIECVFQIQQRTNPTEMIEILETFLPEKQRRIGAPNAYTDSKRKG
ncbi:motility protein A [Magnetospira sp. QH-2]|uniref:motility protein A n=1 Tax=Magnetospira sp. (strain QH-2) TaxID=1288970 RepID=UPI0003E8130B|nr:MotA/TolQ/ExbB proton channel family protein [Magnetospira sp. QH-2]CCQ73598.1 Chemotaxis protein motA [Magnetospira sp. QH-2]